MKQQEHYNMDNDAGQMVHAISALAMVRFWAKVGGKLVCCSLWSAPFTSSWVPEQVL